MTDLHYLSATEAIWPGGVHPDPVDGLVPVGLGHRQPEVEGFRTLGDIVDCRLVGDLEGA